MTARTLGLVVLLVTAVLAGSAHAVDPVPPGTVEYGRVIVLKDKRAGFFEDVRKTSQQVSYVRDGIERPATPGLVVYEGDAIRTAAGSCVVETRAGYRVEIGERSQVRLEKTVLQRLGEVFYKVQGAFRVKVGDVELLVEGTGFKVVRDLPGNGELIVPEGRVRVRPPNTPGELVQQGHALEFTQEQLGALRMLDSGEVAAIEAWRAERFTPSVVTGLRRNRALIRLEGGVSWFDLGNGWGRGTIEGRFRTLGPLWLQAGIGILGRDVDETNVVDRAFVLPVHVGARFVADLPRSFFISGGADLQVLIGSRCSDLQTCQRVPAAEPGGRLAIAGGLLLSQRVGLDIEFSGGVLRKVLPPPDPATAPTSVVDPQIHLSIGFFLRL